MANVFMEILLDTTNNQLYILLVTNNDIVIWTNIILKFGYQFIATISAISFS